MSPDSYAHVWFRSLFAAKIDVNVVLNLWDMYFQLGDQFLIFFMPLILLLNMKDDIMSSNEIDKSELLSKLFKIFRISYFAFLLLIILFFLRNDPKRAHSNQCKRLKRFQQSLSSFCPKNSSVIQKGKKKEFFF
jgi:hypothetical protein